MKIMSMLTIALFMVATVSVQAKTKSKTEVDIKNSTFKWKGAKKVGDAHTGKIALKSAKVEMDKGKIKTAQLEMDMKSITNEDLTGKWKTKLEGHLKSGDFFDVDNHPTAKLEITKQIDDSTVAGTLTIKDKPQPVKVKFKKKGKTYMGTLKFDRTKHGVIYGSGNYFKELAVDKIIKNDITLEFKVVTK